MSGATLACQVLEARLCLIVPKVVKANLGWLLQIHASRRGHGVVEVAHWGSSVPASFSGDNRAMGLLDASHTELVLSVRLDISQYSNAYATVRVPDGSTGGAALLRGDGSYIIDRERLTG